MSLDLHASIRNTSEELLVDVAWGQWATMSSLVSQRSIDAKTIIDPEALLLSSIIGSNREKRLLDLAAGWLQQGARLISTQRTRTLASRLPDNQKHAFATIAALAVRAGDHRWKPYALARTDADATEVRVKDLGPLRLDLPQSLMLRLRAGFGMGTKADVLAVLLGMDEPMTLRAISENLSYGSRPLRLALEDMVLAGFVERVASTPAAFRIAEGQWQVLLNGGYNAVPARENYPPAWQPWSDVMLLCSHIIAWSRSAEAEAVSPYVAASRSRDIVDSFLTPTLVRRFALKGPTVSERWELQSLERLVQELDTKVREAA